MFVTTASNSWFYTPTNTQHFVVSHTKTGQ